MPEQPENHVDPFCEVPTFCTIVDQGVATPLRPDSGVSRPWGPVARKWHDMSVPYSRDSKVLSSFVSGSISGHCESM